MPQYQGVWTLQQQMQALTSGQWATDPNFKNTTLLLQGDGGANGAQNNTFYDTSPNQFAITRNGNTTQGTFSPFSLQPGAWSNYLASSGRLLFTVNSAFDITQGDFTVEAWVNISSYSADQHIAWYRNDTPSSGWGFRINATTGYLLFFYTGGSTVTSTSAVPLNSWAHVAACRSGGTCYLFINGTQVGSASFSNGTTQTSFGFRIGANSGGTENLIGYISNFRLVKSGALYTSSFTPSTTPLTTTVSAGTVSLLTCQSNRFVDNSSNAFAITLEGTTTSVQAFSPFAPQFQYTASVTGGSGYFDGTGDYLSVASNAAFDIMGGSYTIEYWYYPVSVATAIMVDRQDPSSPYTGYSCRLLNATAQTADLNWNPGFTGSLTTTTAPIKINQWNHIAYTCDGTTLRIYANGNLEASTTTLSSSNYSGALTIGARATNTQPTNAYFSGFILRKGTASYTGSTYTVPTTPPTAITNTQLLLNYTNAGILDGTMKNVMETVSGAQVSTSVVKYGSGSLKFNGTTDYLVIPATSAWQSTLGYSQGLNFGTGDFTVECWVYFNATATYTTILASRNYSTGASSTYGNWDLRAGTGDLYRSYSNSTTSKGITGTFVWNTNVWYHVAWVRLNGVVTVYQNGVAIGTVADTTSLTDGQYGATVACNFDTAGTNGTPYNLLNGYIDDLRITKGIARYTQNFIPPSVALPRQ